HRDLQIEPCTAAPGGAIVDVTGEALLAAIEVDGGHPLTGLQQGNSNVQGGRGLARPALLVAQHDHVGRSGLSLTRLHKHRSTPVDIFKSWPLTVKSNARHRT